MPIEVNDSFRVAGFGTWVVLYGTLAVCESHPADQKLWVFVPSALASLSLVAFLLFKTAHYFPATSVVTAKGHDFFYASRNGSAALLALSLAWCVDVICTLVDTFDDLMSSKSIGKALDKLNTQGIFGMIMSDGLKMFIVFYSLFLLGWVFWTGFKAFWRVKAALGRQQDYEAGLGLGLGLGPVSEQSN